VLFVSKNEIFRLPGVRAWGSYNVSRIRVDDDSAHFLAICPK